MREADPPRYHAAMTTTSAPGYRVHESRIRTAASVLVFGGLPAVLMVVLLWHLPDSWPIILVLLLCEVLFWDATWSRVRSAVRHELLFAIDADGVFLGLETHPSSVREPWSCIDQVVYFTVSVSMTEGSRNVRYVGIARHGRIVKNRDADRWHFDIDLAAAAIERFGQGATLVEAPSMDLWTGQEPVIIPLPPDWPTRHPRANP